MERIEISPRHNYQEKIEAIGFNFHTDYWKENAYYRFHKEEIEVLERASEACYQMYCDAVQYVIDHGLWEGLHIPEALIPYIVATWEHDLPSLYGRFDFAWIGGCPKLLEFNADTPTSLLEASIIQWHWKEDVFPEADQFNSIHENLVQSWKDIHAIYQCRRYHFCSIQDNVEDEETTQYILATAQEAGLNTVQMDIGSLDLRNDSFYDPAEERVDCVFKLYPWEWMMNESEPGCQAGVRWIEPLWKSIMSNKALLPVLYELFPKSPYILPAYCREPKGLDYCRKPIFSREGANVRLVKGGKTLEETSGEYGEEGYIYQQLVEIRPQGGRYPVIGSWIIGGVPAGIGIRETTSRITDNMSYFVPHLFV